MHCDVVTGTFLAPGVILCAYCPVSASYQTDTVSFVNARSSVGSSTEMVLLKNNIGVMAHHCCVPWRFVKYLPECKRECNYGNGDL